MLLLLLRFDGVPRNLEHLLRTYGAEGERKSLYKRLYGLLWVSKQCLVVAVVSCLFYSMDLGRLWGQNIPPTYVYPSALKAVVRARYPHAVKDWEDPVGPKVNIPQRLNSCTNVNYISHLFIAGIPCDLRRFIPGQVAKPSKEKEINFNNNFVNSVMTYLNIQR